MWGGGRVRWNHGVKIVVWGLSAGGLLVADVPAAERPEAAVSNIVLSLLPPAGGGVRLQIDYPSAFSSRLDIYISTNLQARQWFLREAVLPTAGSNVLEWTDSTSPSSRLCFYLAGNADLDTDQDGLADAREILIYQTAPAIPDSDADGVPDGAEVRRGTDPLAGDSTCITLYADSDAGSDGYDGYTPGITGSHGPKRSLGAAAEASYPHDVIQLSGSARFSESSLVLGAHDITVRPVGSIWIQP